MSPEIPEEEMHDSAEEPTPPSPIFQGNFVVFPLFFAPKGEVIDYKITQSNSAKCASKSTPPNLPYQTALNPESSPKTEWLDTSLFYKTSDKDFKIRWQETRAPNPPLSFEELESPGSSRCSCERPE